MDHLCYELDEHEWREFIGDMERMTYEQRDYSYTDEFIYMGLHVRKRTDKSKGEQT